MLGLWEGRQQPVHHNTKKALIECAYFKPEEIIGKSVKYNLTSDAAHKFERGVDIQAQEKVLRRFIEIVNDHAQLRSIKIQTFDDTQVEQIESLLDLERVNKILGIDIEERAVFDHILSKLGFGIDNNEISMFLLIRHDISSQNDLAEEIARIIGYNNIESKPLEISKKTDEGFDQF